MADTEVVLLPEADGSVGEVSVRNAGGEVLLQRPFDATGAAAGTAPSPPAVRGATDILARFRELLGFQSETGFGDPGDLQRLFGIGAPRTDAHRRGQVDGGTAPALTETRDRDEDQEEDGNAEPSGAAAVTGSDSDRIAADDEQSEEGDAAGEDEAGPYVDDAGRPPRLLPGDDGYGLPPRDDFGDRLEFSLGALAAFGFDDLGDFFAAFDLDDFLDGLDDDNDDDDLGNDETISGSSGDDSLRGGPGRDLIQGGDGDDFLDGGPGDDELRGGDGDDSLAGAQGADELDGGGGTDTADYGTAPGPVLVDLDNGFGLFGDAQGDALDDIENVRGGGAADTLIGDDGDNLLDGEGGPDSLTGGDGDDTLAGGAGIDTLDGEGDADTVTYARDPAGVAVDLSAGTGVDGLGATDRLADIENVIGSDFADDITGDGGDNDLAGQAGDDTLAGLGGSDALDGGAGADTADYAASAAAVNVDLGTGTGTGGDAQGDTYGSIESVTGSGSDDTLRGDGDDNLLVGNAGDDILTGARGVDTLRGGAGDDTLDGAQGADELDGGAGFDIADYSSSPAGVSVDLGAGTGSAGDADGDSFAGIEGLTGTDRNDTLTGDGNDNLLDGRAGDDALSGGAGADTLVGGAGRDALDGGAGDDDVLDYSASAAGVALAFADTDNNGIGGAFTNTAAGGLAGDANGDSFAGFERFNGTDFDDTVGGALTDMIVVLGAGNDVFDNPAQSQADEFVFGGDGNDAIFTGDSDDRLFGGDGDDKLRGEGDDDTLSGDAGADDLDGGAGDDSLDGGDGVDDLDGGEGSDSLDGGAGADVMRGGGGQDSFIYDAFSDGTGIAANVKVAASGLFADTIADFVSGTDRFVFDAAVFGNVGLAFSGDGYDGTNSGVANGATFVYDGQHLIYDPDVNQAGYVAIADIGAQAPVAGDITVS